MNIVSTLFPGHLSLNFPNPRNIGIIEDVKKHHDLTKKKFKNGQQPKKIQVFQLQRPLPEELTLETLLLLQRKALG